MTNKAALFERSIQYLPFTIIVMTLSMKPSIDYSLDLMFTHRGSDFERLSADWSLFSSGIRFPCGELISGVSHD